jgi:hypothetical protein
MRRSVPIFLGLCAVVAATPLLAADLSSDLNLLVFKGDQQLPRELGLTSVRSLATGDFDCDGSDDLAVGDDTSFVGSSQIPLAGSVSIGFGDRLTGLRTGGGQLINQDSSGIIGAAEQQDRFGEALAASDFNADGCSDLAIGVPGEDDAGAGTTDSGGAHVLFGAAGGLSGSNDLFLPGSEPAPNGTTSGHRKGEALTALRWTSASALPFLAISAVGHAPNLLFRAGGVAVRRSGSGLLATPVDFVSRSDFPFETDRIFGFFGSTLAAGDFNNDGFDDLVAYAFSEGCIVPGPPALCNEGRGILWIVYGASAVSGFEYERIDQDTPGVPGAPENSDAFGRALAVGDFNNDGRDDLAVGAPGEDIGNIVSSGSVTILYGANGGLRGNAGTSIAFGQTEIDGLAAEAGDEFGAALSVGDFNRDGFDDLAIGVPLEDVGAVEDAGSVAVVYGSPAGIDTGVSKVFDLSTSGISGNAATDDRFGIALSAGDFNDDQVDDLAVGIENRRNPFDIPVGAVSMIFSTADTVTSIESITPNPVLVGQPYTVAVRSTRQNTGGTQLGRGTVIVSVSGNGGTCTATLSNVGTGSCQISTVTAGLRTVSATHPAILGYRASSAAPAALNVISPPGDAIFANAFE